MLQHFQPDLFAIVWAGSIEANVVKIFIWPSLAPIRLLQTNLEDCSEKRDQLFSCPTVLRNDTRRGQRGSVMRRSREAL